MKITLVASLGFAGLAGLAALAPCANAQQKTTTVAFVQKFQPVARSYPGVSVDMLGIRTGMTVSQAEAIAAKNYQSKPQEYNQNAPDTYIYKEVIAQSHPFVQHVEYTKQTGHTSDTLTLEFSSPVTGNTLLGMTREIKFGEDPNSALSAPLVSTLKATLIKKYGPASYQSEYSADEDQSDTAWIFTQNSLITCTEYCGSNGLGLQQNDLTQLDPARDGTNPATNPDWDNWSSLELQCGAGGGKSFVLFIWAHILTNRYDKTKATKMIVAMGDTGTCIDDGKEAVKQLKAAAIKFYKTVSKAPAAPKM